MVNQPVLGSERRGIHLDKSTDPREYGVLDPREFCLLDSTSFGLVLFPQPCGGGLSVSPEKAKKQPQ